LELLNSKVSHIVKLKLVMTRPRTSVSKRGLGMTMSASGSRQRTNVSNGSYDLTDAINFANKIFPYLSFIWKTKFALGQMVNRARK